jgi:hypothetical protein
MFINWLVLAPTPEGIPVPTYGNYGGPDYSGGKIVGPGESPDFTVAAKDPLDELFLRHDEAHANPASDALSRAQADIALIQGIQALPENAVSAEGDLYAGAAILATIYQISVVDRHPELLASLDVKAVVQKAAGLIEQGSVEPDPQEVAGLINWAGNTVAALAAVDDPILRQIAGTILDHVSGFDFTRNPQSEVETFGSVLNAAAPLLAQAVEAIADNGFFDPPASLAGGSHAATVALPSASAVLPSSEFHVLASDPTPLARDDFLV